MLKAACRTALISISLAFLVRPEPGWCQTISSFGVPPIAAPATFEFSYQDIEHVINTRVCNISIPLVGGKSMMASSTPILKDSIRAYSGWEKEYKQFVLGHVDLNTGASKKNSFKTAESDIREQINALKSIGTSDTDIDAYISLPKKDPAEIKYFKQRLAGTPQKLITLFTTVFLIRRYLARNDPSKVLEISDRAINEYKLVPTYHRPDKAERGTYLTFPTLTNITFFFRSSAKLMTDDSEKQFFDALDYIAMRNDILPTVVLFNEHRRDQAILLQAGRLAIMAANADLGDGAAQHVAATWMSTGPKGTSAYIVLRGVHPVTMKVDVSESGSGINRKFYIKSDGSLQSLRSAIVRRVEVLTPTRAFKEYQQFVDRQLVANSTTDISLYDLRQEASGVTIRVGDKNHKDTDGSTNFIGKLRKVHLSRKTYEKFLRSENFTNQSILKKAITLFDGLFEDDESQILVKAVLKDNEASNFVGYTNPFAARSDYYRSMLNQFSFKLNYSLHARHAYRDPLTVYTSQHAKELTARKIGSAANYIIYVDNGIFNVKDYKIISDIEKLMKRVGVRVIVGAHPPSKPRIDKNIIIVSANSDEGLSKYISALGKAGAFTGNYVMLNTCETPITQKIADKITRQYGAKAVFLHSGFVKASTIQDMLVSLSKSIAHKPNGSLVDALRNITRDLSIKAIWTLCDVRSYSPAGRINDRA